MNVNVKRTLMLFGLNFFFCRPLAFTLHALVNASFVDGDMDVIHCAVSCLQKILFAIKQAEDAVDAHTTPVAILLLKPGCFLCGYAHDTLYLI